LLFYNLCSIFAIEINSACTIASATGVLSTSFIFQACDKAESADELNQMLESNILSTPDAIGVPIGVPLNGQDQEYIKHFEKFNHAQYI
jgi:hypothetical protein